jgi:hypothetical protein
MKNYVCCNGWLAKMLGEFIVRFIALFSPFERTKSPVCGGKVGQVTLKYQLDPAAMLLPGEINAMRNCV